MNLNFIISLVILVASVTGRKSNSEETLVDTGSISAEEIAATEQKCHTFIQIYNHSGYSLYKVSEVITLSCSLTTNSNFNSSFYLIHYGNQQRLEPSYSDGNLSVFEIKSAALEDDGQYNCYYGNCNKPSFNSMIHIAVVEMTRPEFECISTDYYNMTCTWFRNNYNYSSRWRLEYAPVYPSGLQPFQNCSGINTEMLSDGERHSCTISHNHFLQSLIYKLQLHENLKAGGRLISAKYTYTIQANESILKLSPVGRLDVYANLPRQMTLTWVFERSPGSLSDGILCHVSYWTEWEPSYKQLDKFVVKSGPLNFNRSLNNLEPFTRYTFNIKVKPVASPYWSDSVILNGRTLPEVPVSIPKNIAYTEVLVPDENQRKIYLYWQPLQKRYWYGPNASYFINTSCIKSAEEVNATLFTVRLDQFLPSTLSCNLTIQSKNSMGLSEDMFQVHIPPFMKDYKPGSVIKATELESNKFNIIITNMSSRSENVKAILYWCQGFPNVTPPICMANFHSQWRSKNNFTIIMNQSDPLHPWYFGAALQNGNQRSSVVWATDDTVVTSQQISIVSNESKNTGMVVGVTFSVLVFLAVGIWCKWKSRMKRFFKLPEIKVPEIPALIEEKLTPKNTTYEQDVEIEEETIHGDSQKQTEHIHSSMSNIPAKSDMSCSGSIRSNHPLILNIPVAIEKSSYEYRSSSNGQSESEILSESDDVEIAGKLIADKSTSDDVQTVEKLIAEKSTSDDEQTAGKFVDHKMINTTEYVQSAGKFVDHKSVNTSDYVQTAGKFVHKNSIYMDKELGNIISNSNKLPKNKESKNNELTKADHFTDGDAVTETSSVNDISSANIIEVSDDFSNNYSISLLGLGDNEESLRNSIALTELPQASNIHNDLSDYVLNCNINQQNSSPASYSLVCIKDIIPETANINAELTPEGQVTDKTTANTLVDSKSATAAASDSLSSSELAADSAAIYVYQKVGITNASFSLHNATNCTDNSNTECPLMTNSNLVTEVKDSDDSPYLGHDSLEIFAKTGEAVKAEDSEASTSCQPYFMFTTESRIVPCET